MQGRGRQEAEGGSAQAQEVEPETKKAPPLARRGPFFRKRGIPGPLAAGTLPFGKLWRGRLRARSRPCAKRHEAHPNIAVAAPDDLAVGVKAGGSDGQVKSGRLPFGEIHLDLRASLR